MRLTPPIRPGDFASDLAARVLERAEAVRPQPLADGMVGGHAVMLDHPPMAHRQASAHFVVRLALTRCYRSKTVCAAVYDFELERRP